MPKSFREGAAKSVAAAIAALQESDPLSWTSLAEIAKPICGGDNLPSRQWLWQHVKEAFHAHQERYDKWKCEAAAPTASLTPRERDARTIRELRAELARRDRILASYDERLAMYLSRAREKGVSQEYLERPLEPVNRGAKRSGGRRRGGLPQRRPVRKTG